jgi:hypothetical protein
VQTERLRLVAAGLLAAVAFCLYYSTLLPGQDLGDTASFQAVAGRRDPTPREGYPLYFALVSPFVSHLPTEPARAANLASAVAGALVVGLVVLAGARLAGSLAAGLAAALLFAGSYTFWSQSIVAEVYALHMLCANASLLALLAWHHRPSLARLALFFACYALGFGNHLSMVLLLPGFAAFLLLASPGGPREMLRPRVVGLAAATAAVFALQYGWNVRSMLSEPNHPGFPDLLRNIWFDVTKSDWRATMVEGISWSSPGQRLAMYWFDLRQQFGVPGVVAAVAGLAWLWRRSWRLGLLLTLLWAVNWWFAFRYNVGDVHVFFIPSHWIVALAAGCAAGWMMHAGRLEACPTVSHGLEACPTVSDGPPARAAVSGRPERPRARHPVAAVARWAAATALLLAYPAWRVYDTYPAVDRSDDREPTRFYDRLTAGIDGRREILGTDLNWQLHNGFDYYAWQTRPDLVVFDVPGALLHFPLLVEHNATLGRSVVLTDGASQMVRQLYGPLFTIERDPRLPVPSLADQVAGLPRGTPYVLVVLESDPPEAVDRADLAAASALLGLSPKQVPGGRYAVAAGLVGEEPWAGISRRSPFRMRRWLGGIDVDIRIESFLPYDTIRRAGFGSVVANRLRVLTIDRGVSFVALGRDGRPVVRAWSGGLYAPQPRYLVKPGR